MPILTGVRDISSGAGRNDPEGRLVDPGAGYASPWPPPLVSAPEAQESLAPPQNTSPLSPIAAHQAACPSKSHWPLHSLAWAVVSCLTQTATRPASVATQFHSTLPGGWPKDILLRAPKDPEPQGRPGIRFYQDQRRNPTGEAGSHRDPPDGLLVSRIPKLQGREIPRWRPGKGAAGSGPDAGLVLPAQLICTFSLV